MESENSIDHLITTATEKLKAFEYRLNQLGLVRFPSNNPKLLIDLFSRIGRAFQNKVIDYRKAFVEATKIETQRGIHREIVFSVILIKTLAARLRYIEGASVERTPWSMVHAIEQLAQGLLNNTLLIIRPQWHYNYGGVDVIDEWRSDVDAAFGGSIDEILSPEEWKSIYSQLPQRFYVLSFPGLERDNVLLHVNLGHEIGHIVLEKFLITEDSNSLKRIRARVEETLESEFQASPLLRDSAVEERVTMVQRIRRRALEEIIADFFSIYLFGPAALFALHEVATFAQSLDMVSSFTHWYPPWRLRLRFALQELSWSEWKNRFDQVAGDFHWQSEQIRGGTEVLDAVDKYIAGLFQIAAGTADQEFIKKNPLTMIAYESLDDTLTAAKSFLKDQLRLRTFVPSKSACKDILSLMERLHYGIPPNEIVLTDGEEPRIADISSIFNAGWFHRVAYLPSMFGFEKPDIYFQQLDILNRLVLKGIEMSDLQREYNAYKTDLA